MNFVTYLNERGFSWKYEPKGYTLSLMEDRVYVPDFYVEDLDLIVEVKGYFWKDSKEKWELFNIEYPHLKKVILFKQDLQSIITQEKRLEDYL